MRQIKHLSPSSLECWLESSTTFYLNYLADNRPTKLPQDQPMAAGSAFDAWVKSYLHKAIYGNNADPRFDRVALFEAQVEEHNRDVAYKVGEYCFNEYKSNGCLGDIMLELQNSVTEPRFEIDVMGQIDGYREGITLDVGAVTILGKPDVFFTNKHGARVVLDWKVNGYYSKRLYSPRKGYVRLRCRGFNEGCHKDAMVQAYKGMRINVAMTMEQVDLKWARQLATYHWLCGSEVGSDDCVGAIDQLACGPDPVREHPQIRVAEHRAKISKDFQFNLFAAYQQLWKCCTSGHFFHELSLEESQQRCAQLDGLVLEQAKPLSDNDEWFRRMQLQ